MLGFLRGMCARSGALAEDNDGSVPLTSQVILTKTAALYTVHVALVETGTRGTRGAAGVLALFDASG